MRIFLSMLFCMLHSSLSLAGLGDTLTAASPDSNYLGAPVTYVSGLAVYQSITEAGMTITYYVNFQGVIVAVSWRGPALPNLKNLLGRHFQTYLLGTTTRLSHRHVEFITPDLVIQSNGHVRAFRGRAFLPKLLTSSNAISQIQ